MVMSDSHRLQWAISRAAASDHANVSGDDQTEAVEEQSCHAGWDCESAYAQCAHDAEGYGSPCLHDEDCPGCGTGAVHVYGGENLHGGGSSGQRLQRSLKIGKAC